MVEIPFSSVGEEVDDAFRLSWVVREEEVTPQPADPGPLNANVLPGGITMRANKRRKGPETAEATETTGTPTAGADETTGTTRSQEQAPSPRTPVEIFDDMIESRKHTTPDPGENDPALAWEREHPDGDSRFGRIRGFQRQGGSIAPSNSHRGRLTSWVAVVLACAGFIVGGVGVVMGMSVPLLVIAGLLLVAAAVMALIFDLMGDVVLDSPRAEPEEPHGTPLHRIKGRIPQQHSSD